MNKKRLVIGISGASGVIYGVRLLQLLQDTDIETHLIMSKTAEQTLKIETDYNGSDIKTLADKVYEPANMAAAVSSGSFKTLGMIVAPCSMRSLAEIASGVTTTLLTRAADVVLKERRRLVLMTRETPLHLIHIQNMLTVTHSGGVIAPPVPAFYNRPQKIADLIDHSVARVLDLFDIELDVLKRWGETNS